MAMAIGTALGAQGLVLFSLCAVGCASSALGGPFGTFIAAVIAAEFGKLVYKETKVDIIVTPTVTIAVGVGISMLVGPGISAVMKYLGNLIMMFVELKPVLMGALVSAVVGICLTLPISSAAICASLALTGIAGGAATAGLLCADGRFCSDEFCRKQMERCYRPGTRNKYAPNGQYRQKARNLASAHDMLAYNGRTLGGGV